MLERHVSLLLSGIRQTWKPLTDHWHGYGLPSATVYWIVSRCCQRILLHLNQLHINQKFPFSKDDICYQLIRTAVTTGSSSLVSPSEGHLWTVMTLLLFQSISLDD